jgi:hypothetical protein
LSRQRIGPRLSFFFFAKKFCRALCTRRGTNEVERANILAPGLRRKTNNSRTPSSRLHRRLAPDDWPWEVVSSYSSATAPDSNGISRADPLIKLAKNCTIFKRLGGPEQALIFLGVRTPKNIAECMTTLCLYLAGRTEKTDRPVGWTVVRRSDAQTRAAPEKRDTRPFQSAEWSSSSTGLCEQ